MVESSMSFDSPVGPLCLTATERGVCRVEWRRSETEDPDHPHLRTAASALERHFGGNRVDLAAEVPLDLRGTEFQLAVWFCLARTVGPGETISYGELAERVGRGSARAVGTAMNKNPIPILVPCHRVLAAGGRPGGFAPGLAMKQRLLSIEGVAFDLRRGRPVA